MASPTASFSSISKISKWVVWWTIFDILTFIIALILLSYENLQYLVASVIDTTILDINLLNTTTIFIGIIGLIVILFWFHRANKNIHAFGAKEITSPRMAVIWWFVPIFHLWKPYDIAQEIWKASNPHLNIINGTEWKHSPASDIIKLWWILGILSFFVFIIGGFFTPIGNVDEYVSSDQQSQDSEGSNDKWIRQYSGGAYKEAFYANFVFMSGNILLIASDIFFIRTIRQISVRQEIKAGKSI